MQNSKPKLENDAKWESKKRNWSNMRCQNMKWMQNRKQKLENDTKWEEKPTNQWKMRIKKNEN